MHGNFRDTPVNKPPKKRMEDENVNVVGLDDTEDYSHCEICDLPFENEKVGLSFLIYAIIF